jgi:pyruvate carboxylase subunit B
MPGAVFKVLISAGDRVTEGQAVLILEAMKMEMEIAAPVAGTIAVVNVAVGEQVATGQVLASINA